MAYQMITVAVGWQAYEITKSTFFLGLIGLFQFIPMFILTIPVGHVADKYDRRFIVGICQACEALGIFGLSVLSFMNIISRELLLLIVFLLGAARAFEGPSLQALMPQLVSREDFPEAAAWGAATFQAAAIFGPAAGGFLYVLKPVTVYAVAGFFLFAAVILLYFVDHVHKALPKEPVTFKSLFAGIHFIRTKPVILGSISLDLFAVLLGGATALLPVYAQNILHTGPMSLGLLRSAPAVGAFVVSLFLASKPIKRNLGRTMFTSVAFFGLATIIFGISRSFWLSFVMLLLLGASDVFSVVIRSSLVQVGTPDAMRGRVSAVNSMFIGTSNQLGEFESGLTAALFGTVPAVVIGGAGTIIVVMIWMKLFPKLLNADKLEEFS
jgi:MFS family permease